MRYRYASMSEPFDMRDACAIRSDVVLPGPGGRSVMLSSRTLGATCRSPARMTDLCLADPSTMRSTMYRVKWSLKWRHLSTIPSVLGFWKGRYAQTIVTGGSLKTAVSTRPRESCRSGFGKSHIYRGRECWTHCDEYAVHTPNAVDCYGDVPCVSELLSCLGMAGRD